MRKRVIVILAALFVMFAYTNSFFAGQDAEDVLATMDDDKITVNDFIWTIQESSPVMLALHVGEQGRQRIFRELVDRKLFSQEARKEGFDNKPMVQWKINAAIEKILSDEYLAQTLSSLEPPSESELIKYYNTHTERFQIGEQVKVRHIVLETEEEASEVLGLIKAGDDFGRVMQERCKSCVGKEGAGSRWIGRGEMPKALEEAAFSLNQGEISGIVKAGMRYHIIQSLEKREPRQRLFFEVKRDISRELYNHKKDEIIGLKREKLVEKYNVKAYPERVPKVNVSSLKPKMTEKKFFEIMEKRSVADIIK